MSSQCSSLNEAGKSEGQRSSSKISVVIEDGVVKSRVQGSIIPNVNFETFFTEVWREHENSIALVDTLADARYTFGELLEASRRVAGGLRRLGLRKEDVVAFHGQNSCEMLVAICGTFFAGVIGMFCKTSLTQGEIRYQLADAKPKLLFCELEKTEEMRQTCKNIPSVEAFFVINGTCEGAHSLWELKQTVLDENETFLRPSPDKTLCIVYSSGTMGLPKGVQLTHRNLIAQVISYGCLDHIFEKGDAVLCPASIMHVGTIWGVFCYLGLGSKVVLLHKMDIPTFLSAADLHKPVAMGGYPVAMHQLDQWPKHDDFYKSSLKKFFIGGGAVSTSILKSVSRKFALKELSQVYGMTEHLCCITCSTHLDDLKSVGKPAPFVEMKVVDFYTRKTLGPNQQGEICVKSPAVFKAYLNQPKATADAFEDGFLRTGDKGCYTADGCFFLCGRFKELIKCMDQQVYPVELEELLAADPEVLHVVVAGVPHPQYGEAARAFVVHQRCLSDALEEHQEKFRLKQLVAVASSSSEGEPSGSKVSVVIEDGVVKTRVKGAVIPDVTFEAFFTDVWREHEDLIALVDSRWNTKYTFGELLDASRRVAAGLRKLGLRTGDVIAFHGPNSIEMVVAMCGAFFAGGVGVFHKSSLTQGFFPCS
ncbi:hypothetical protein MTO96_028938 [Rhipicephalus appendiculatus]